MGKSFLRREFRHEKNPKCSIISDMFEWISKLWPNGRVIFAKAADVIKNSRLE